MRLMQKSMMNQKDGVIVSLLAKGRPWLTIFGAMLAFAGERYLGAGRSYWWCVGGGWALMFLGVIAAVMTMRNAARRGYVREILVWALAICWQSLILLSYFMFAVYKQILGTRPAPDDLSTKLLLAAWVLFFVFGSSMGVGMEWAQRTNGRGLFAEPGRIRRATKSWLKIGILAVIIGALQFAAVRRNVSWDLSYLKTARPGSTTMGILDALSQDVEVVLFFPTGNEVLSQVNLYAESLKGRPHLQISTHDVELDPVVAESFKVGRNGSLVLRSGGQIERVDFGLTLSSARKGLKNIDSEFQRALLAVTEKKKTLYFLRGHGELTWNGGDDESGLKSLKSLESFLRSVNFNLKFFGMSEGSAKKVPADADAVVIVGGLQPILSEELSALEEYVNNGGRVFALLDLDVTTDASIDRGVRDVSKDPLVRWLAGLGVEFVAKVLANENNFIAATRSPADSWFLFTNVFTSHESVQKLARNDQRAAVVTFRSGYLKTRTDLEGWNVQDTVRSLSDTFADDNRDFKLSPGEKRHPRVIGAAVEKKLKANSNNAQPGRVVVFADASSVSDALLRNQANLIYFIDGLRWLVGDTKASGVANSEEDIRIRHTNKEDIAWFYGTVALVPGLVLLVGALVRRRFKGKVS
jgi:hypothetical protein